MGFDNECIPNIQSLPGEYFCPVCRTLIYPHEALQTQCTHLYCKPCLAYVAATTQACPYDGYLVTEADSKPLVDLNKSLAETIGKVAVHCLYNKSGCQWQGNLSECIAHGNACAYGNSPVVCNRCGTQIVHRQVQEHAQLCPGVQPQTQNADNNLTQSSAATTQAVTQGPSAVSSLAPAAVPSATTAGAVTAPAVATSSAGATTTSMMVVASFAGAPTAASQGQAVPPQTQTAEQYQQQLQYQQYYQQHFPGYNPYTQQYQQYGQYQQYTQPQTQAAMQNVAQVPGQPAPYAQPQYLQPSQPQHMVPNQPQNQSHHPQLQASVQPQPQPNPPLHSAPQNPQIYPQGDVQPIAHTQVGSQPFATPTTQAIASQVQPHAQPHPPQHQQAVAQHQYQQMQFLPQQQHLQSQIQHQQPQVQQQSYSQPQVYHQPHPVAQPQNPSVHAVASHQSYSQPQPTHQMPHGAPLQRPAHASQQQLVGPQHPALHPPQGQFPLQGQQPAMLAPQGTQHTSQHQQHVGHHVQRPPMHSSIPSQALPQGFPLNTSVPSQTGQSYQQGMHSSQQHMHSQPFQPHGPPFMQQQQHVPTSTSRSMSNAATPLQFQESGKSENAANATGNTEVGDITNEGGESSGIKPESLGDKNVNGEQNDFGSTRKNVEQTGIALGSADGSDKGKGKDEFGGQKCNSQSEASNISNDLENGGSLQQASQKDLGALGSYVPPGMGRHRLSGPDTLLPQHMLHPSQTNQMRPPGHSFSENILPTMQQQPYGLYQSEMAPRTLAPYLPRPAPIRSDDGMIRTPMGGPLPGHHDTTMPSFAPESVGHPYPAGMTKSNGVGSGPLGNSRAFHEEGFNSSREHFRSLAPPYPGRYNVDPKYIEEKMKPFPGPTHLDGDGFQRSPRPFDGFDPLPGRPPFPNKPDSYPVGFPEDLSRKPHPLAGHPDFVSPGADFGLHRIDGMPRHPGPFLQGMAAGPGGLPKDQLGPGNLPGNIQHDFGNPGFPHTHFHPGDTFLPRNLHGVEPLGHLHGIEPSGHRFRGHVHPDDPNRDDYSRHGFPQESGRFSSGGFFSNGDVGWCRICMFNCGSAEDLGLHVHTREHQQHAMDIVLKMKNDVAKRLKMNPGGPKSFNKKVAMKGNFRGNRR